MTAFDAGTIACALGGWNGQRPTGRRSGWLARCPAHADRGPSLSLANAPDGRLLLHCFAGCTFAEVRAALIQRGILRPNDNRSRRQTRRFRISNGDKLMLMNVIEGDPALGAAWRTGDVEFFVARFLALKGGCDGPDMAARCSILDLGPDATAFARMLFGVGP